MTKLTKARSNQFLKAHWRPGESLCFYCQKVILRRERSIDHLTPHSRGGGIGDGNLVLCCRSCNNAKSDMTLAEFVEFVAANGGIMNVRRLYGNSPHSRRPGKSVVQ